MISKWYVTSQSQYLHEWGMWHMWLSDMTWQVEKSAFFRGHSTHIGIENGCVSKMSLLLGSFAKETYNLIDPTNQSHPISALRTDERMVLCECFIYTLCLCVAVCCSVLQCVAVCCSVLRSVSHHLLSHVRMCYIYVLYMCVQVAVCCSMLQYVTVCCSGSQCVAVCCSVLHCVAQCLITCSVMCGCVTYMFFMYVCV